MSLRSENAALLLIDIQKGLEVGDYYGSSRNNPDAEKQAAILLARWRSEKLPVFHVRHSSQNPDSPLHASKPGFAIKEVVLPIEGEKVITKNVNSAFIGTDLLEQIKASNTNTAVIIGLTTNHCISTSVRMAANLGLTTYLISDATATFNGTTVDGKHIDAETMHQTALASLNNEFATVLDTQAILALLT